MFVFQVYLQHLRREVSPDMSSREEALVKENNAYLNELEKISIDMNMLAPSLAAVPNPKPGIYGSCYSSIASFTSVQPLEYSYVICYC